MKENTRPYNAEAREYGDKTESCYKEMYERLYAAVTDAYSALYGAENMLCYVSKQLLKALEVCEIICMNSPESD